MLSEPTHHTILTNGVNLHVVQAGPQDGPLVILLHGFPEFWYGWRFQIGFLGEHGYRVWVPDQRGYNLSEKPEGIQPYNLDELARDVTGLIDAAEQERAYLVGHDWGAAVAWWTAIKHPQRVKKLVILNVPHPSVTRRTVRKHPPQMLKSWYIFFFQLPWLPEKLASRSNYRLLVRGMQSSSRPGTFAEADFEEYRKAWSQPGAMTAMINWYRAGARTLTTRPASSRVTVPALILWGVKDNFIIPESARMSLKYCNDADLEYFPDATHWVQHEEPERINIRLAEFMIDSKKEATR